MGHEPSRRDVLRGIGGLPLGGYVLGGETHSSSAEQTGQAWRQFGHDSGNTSHAPGNTGPTSALLGSEWVSSTGSVVRGSPVLAEDTLYFGGDAVYAVDPENGTERWTFSIDGSIDHAPAVVGDTVYAGSDRGVVYAIGAADGTQRWSYSTAGRIESPPVVVDDTVYAKSGDRRLVAIEGGSERWSDEFENAIEYDPAVADGAVFVCSDDMHALDAADGSRLWQTPVAGTVVGPPIATDGEVYVGSEGGIAYALNATDSAVQWSQDVGGAASPQAVADGTVYFAAQAVVYALAQSDGAERWVYETDDPVRGMAVADGEVYLSDCALYSLDSSDGTQEWKSFTHPRCLSRPVVADGAVYGTIDGETHRVVEATVETDPATPHPGDTVSFSLGQQLQTETSAEAFVWQIGSEEYEGETATHTFPERGTYDVTLTISRGLAEIGRIETSVSVEPVTRPDPAIAVSNATPTTGESVTFDGSDSVDPNGSITEFQWTIDGRTVAGETVEYTFADSGTRTVELTVTDDDGETATATQSVTVRSRPPNAAIGISPSQPVTGETVTFDGSDSSDPDGVFLDYKWTIGTLDTAGPTVERTFEEPGTRDVELTVTDNSGKTDTATLTITVRSRSPTADIGVTPESPTTGERVTFDASGSTAPRGPITGYEWTIAGETVTGETVEYTVEDSGTTTVKLTVATESGATDTATRTLDVRTAPPTPEISISPSTPETGETVTFDASGSTDPDGTITGYEWTIGGETYTGETVTHTFEASGSRRVTLRITDDDGATENVSSTLEVSAARPGRTTTQGTAQPSPTTTESGSSAAASDESGVPWIPIGAGTLAGLAGVAAYSRFGGSTSDDEDDEESSAAADLSSEQPGQSSSAGDDPPSEQSGSSSSEETDP